MSPHRRSHAQSPCRLPRGWDGRQDLDLTGWADSGCGTWGLFSRSSSRRPVEGQGWQGPGAGGTRNVGAWARAACARTFLTPNTPRASPAPVGWRLFQAWVEQGSRRAWGADPAEAF